MLLLFLCCLRCCSPIYATKAVKLYKSQCLSGSVLWHFSCPIVAICCQFIELHFLLCTHLPLCACLAGQKVLLFIANKGPLSGDTIPNQNPQICEYRTYTIVRCSDDKSSTGSARTAQKTWQKYTCSSSSREVTWIAFWMAFMGARDSLDHPHGYGACLLFTLFKKKYT